jgi:hypothetical protein
MSDEHDVNHNVEHNDVRTQAETKRAWQEPKLEFVEPKLVKQGEMKQITAQGFIGTFVPD